MCALAVLAQGGVAVEAEAGTDFSAVLSLTSGRSVVIEMKNGKIQSQLGRKADASTYFSLASVSGR